MRAATKVASFGINVGLRNAGAYSPSQEQSVRNASRSVVVGKLTSSSSSSSLGSGVVDNNNNVLVSSTATSSFDDWEFAEQDDVLFDSINPKPRLVFGGVPSYEEAKEATNDLKEALEREYFCSSNTTSLSNSGYSETKSRIASESSVVSSSVTKPIFHAFSMLKGSSEAQSVVASLASDKNVWDAVMQNEKVMEFISMQQNTAPSELYAGVNQPFLDNLKSRGCNTENAEDEKFVVQQNFIVSENDTDIKQHSRESVGMKGVYDEGTGNEFMEFIEKVKVTVKDMINRLSGFFQNIFGSTEDRVSMDENGNATVKASIGASFMALAVLTIMVAVLKRA